MTYADEDWRRYEPESIRARLPLEWLVGHLYGVWDAGPQMTSCPFPDHGDSTPSFNLWAENDDGFAMRYGCFGCGDNGDAVDLIRRHRGVGFLEACRIAVEELIPELEASDWRPAERERAEVTLPKTHGELEAVLRRITGSAPSGPALSMFTDRKFPGGPEIFSYAHMSWGWRGFLTPAPTVLFPHRDWDRRYTGIRYRSARRNGTRWTERGSRFPALYGAWRDQGNPSVLLCEGETDTVWAAFQTDRDVLPLDVLGLPAGAAQKPGEESVRRLGMRTVYLAFDADMAGRIATARWREALDGVAYRVAVCPIPEGEDVLSCGIPIGDLIGDAE